MSVIILGQTRCAICAEILQKGDKIVSFSPFVTNRRDRLYRFSDSAFHRDCFDRDPLAAAASQRSEEVRRRGELGQRRCIVCGEQIVVPDDYFGVGFLTDETTSPLHKFNYFHIHRSHFNEWEHAKDFQSRIEAFQSSEAWEGPMVTFDPLPSWVAPPCVRHHRKTP